jgi:hypothetical protein
MTLCKQVIKTHHHGKDTSPPAPERKTKTKTRPACQTLPPPPLHPQTSKGGRDGTFIDVGRVSLLAGLAALLLVSRSGRSLLARLLLLRGLACRRLAGGRWLLFGFGWHCVVMDGVWMGWLGWAGVCLGLWTGVSRRVWTTRGAKGKVKSGVVGGEGARRLIYGRKSQG